jgi:hypothetical protein
MITDKLIHRLRERFAGRAVVFGVPPAACATFAAAHPAVGDIQIFDDGSEVTLMAGRFTHDHFSDFDSKSAEEAENNIVDDVVAFLDRLFADQVVLWGSHRGRGGWYIRGAKEVREAVRSNGPLYVWSGPLREESPPP